MGRESASYYQRPGLDPSTPKNVRVTCACNVIPATLEVEAGQLGLEMLGSLQLARGPPRCYIRLCLRTIKEKLELS